MSKWINVKERLPEKASFCLVVVNELQPYTDKYMNEQFKDEVKIIYYFKERATTGWQNDWRGRPSNVKYWMPVPPKPEQQ